MLGDNINDINNKKSTTTTSNPAEDINTDNKQNITITLEPQKYTRK